MKKIISLLWILFLLTSCYSNTNDSKKVACSEIDINADIKENWVAFAEQYTIDEIFYSTSEDKCIWIVTLILEYWQDVWAYDISNKDWFLNKWYDTLGTCSFWWESSESTETCLKQEKVFDERIQELKNEVIN